MDNENEGWPKPKQNQRMPVKAITEPPQERARAIFIKGECLDIAEAPMIEVSGIGVVKRMRALPQPMGRQCQDTDEMSRPIVCGAAAKESAMPAIVLDHKKAHQKSCGGDRKQQREPVANVQRRPHRTPERRKRETRQCEFEQRP